VRAGRAQAFAPVAAADARALILGSLPGERSLAQGEYYAHPQNAFWRLVGAVIGVDLASMRYEERLAALRGGRIALWDVISSATRRGSLDTAIRDAERADLSALIASLPDLRVIAFNGKTAARIGRRQFAGVGGLNLIDLPSSSPAYASLRFEAKLARWSLLKPHLG
jgi:hypoxanthine-DNA glycosylase